MAYGLRILPAADDDVDGIAMHIAQDNVKQAGRFYDQITVTYKAICEHPHRWPLYGFENPNLRELRRHIVTGFRHYLVF